MRGTAASRAGDTAAPALAPHHRRDRRAPARPAFDGPHARAVGGFPGLPGSRAGYATATPEEVVHHDGEGGATVWPLRDRHRRVVRALLLHGPAASAWQVDRGRGRFADPSGGDRTPDGALRGDRRHWRPPHVLLLDADDAPVHFVPLHRWHPWGPVHGTGDRTGRPLTDPRASAAAACGVLERTGWAGLLAAAGLPLTTAHSVREEDVQRVARAAAGRATGAVSAPLTTAGERRRSLLVLLVVLGAAAAQVLGLPHRGGGPAAHDPGLQALVLGAWAVSMAACAAGRLSLVLRARRARRALPAEVVLGDRRGVELLLGRRPDGTLELGVREGGVEAWVPSRGPGALATVTVAHCPGPVDRRAAHPDRRSPRPPEVRLTTADGGLLSTVGVPALLGADPDRVPGPGDAPVVALVEGLRSVADRLGARFEVVAWPPVLPAAGPPGGDRGYPAGRTWEVPALFVQLLTVWWSLRLALGGSVAWWVVPAGVLALGASLALLTPRRPGGAARGARVLP